VKYRLREGLHWCQCAGRIVFLDLLEDRYSCLSQGASAAFLALASGRGGPEEGERLRSLILRGLLLEDRAEGSLDRPVRLPPVSGDFVHEPYPRPSGQDLLRAVTCQIGWGLLVRARPLATIVAQLEGRPRHRSSDPAAIGRIERAISAFAAVSGLFPPQDRCLVRALALHAACRRNGLRPSLVFAVRMNPFRAHCWVQLGTKVLIGDFEQARLFTPIAAFR
jgi:hypothetical protein